MVRSVRTRDGRGERGQLLPILAVMILLILAAAAVPVDGGLALETLREGQNAADAAAEGGAAALATPCFRPGRGGSAGQAPTVATMTSVIDALLADNAPDGSPAWTGTFLDATGATLRHTSGAAYDIRVDTPPSGACGVSLRVRAERHNTLAALLGFDTTSVTATGAALLRWSGGVLALARYGRHTFHAKGLGDLTIDGNLYVDSQGCLWNARITRGAAITGLTQTDVWWRNPLSGQTCAPGTGIAGRPYQGEDVIDNFDFSGKDYQNLQGLFGTQLRAVTITGPIYSSTRRPFDSLFYDTFGFNAPPGVYELSTVGSPPNGAQEAGHSGQLFETVYFAIDQANLRIGSVPVTSGSGLPNPLSGLPAPDPDPTKYCATGATDPAPLLLGGVWHYRPGTYTRPTIVPPAVGDTHDVVFDGCGSYPGVYRFDRGVEICPEATGQTVTNTPAGVVLYSGGPWGIGAGDAPGASRVPLPGCPGVAKTTPFYEPSRSFCPPGSGTAGAPFPGQVVCYENDDQILDAGSYGSGSFGITIGGHGTVTLSAPATGTYRGIVLFQDPAAGLPDGHGANIGLDPYPGPLADQPGYDPDHMPSALVDPDYHDDRHVGPNGYEHVVCSASCTRVACGAACPIRTCPGCAPLTPPYPPELMPDTATISLSGIVYDIDARMTGPSASKLATLACAPSEDDPRYPRPGDPTLGGPYCYFGGGLPPGQPSPGASVPPAALYADGTGAGYLPWPTCADVTVHQAACEHQLQPADLWRVLCSTGTPSAAAGRLQLGQSTCSNDPAETVNYITPTPQSGSITITGAAIADVFTTTGGATAEINVRAVTDVAPIPAPGS